MTVKKKTNQIVSCLSSAFINVSFSKVDLLILCFMSFCDVTNKGNKNRLLHIATKIVSKNYLLIEKSIALYFRYIR